MDMRLFTADAMRRADRRAVALGYPSLLLMEAAGRAVAHVVRERFPDARTVWVIAGKGNNGGDGFAAARWLLLWGYEVAVYAPDGQDGDAARARRALEAHGVTVQPLAALDLAGAGVVVDALVGTGVSRPLTGVYAEVAARVNASGLPVVAVDLPSGVPFMPHVCANVTVALAGLKLEHLFYPARAACGRIVLDGIGMPPGALEDPELPELLTPEAMQALVPDRPGNAHKGSVGRVLVVGGYATYTGAPVLAAQAAYRAGAGLVTLAYPEGVPLEPPLEVVRLPLPAWRADALRAARAEAVAVGMGAGPGGRDAARAVLELGLPTVLDADALTPEVVAAYRGRPTVITPHPGEAARLLGRGVEAVAADPLEAARALAERYGVTVVLKGGPTVLAEGACLAVNTTGNAAMATGGMGDVLSGVIAALLAAGLRPWDAARLGVYWHGLAGDRLGRVGLLAHEVAEALPEAREALCSGAVRPFWV